MFDWVSDKTLTLPGKIAWGSILSLVFLVPITFSGTIWGLGPFTGDVFDTPKVFLIRFLALVIAGAWSFDFLKYGGKLRYSKWIFIGLGVYVVWVALATVFALEPMQSLVGKYRRYDGLWSTILYAVLFFVTMQYATSYSRAKQIAMALSWASLMVGVYGLLQAFGADPFSWGRMPFEKNRSFSTYGNPDLLAGFLAFGVFINAGLALSEAKQSARVRYWLIFLFNSIVVITAFSRSIWVGSAVAAFVLVALSIRQRFKLYSVDYALLATSALTVLGFVGFSLTRADAVMNFFSRLGSIFNFGEGSALTRFEIWDAAWRASLERPIFGWGPDSFRVVFRMFQPAAYAQDAGFRSVADNVHNYPLQLVVSIGFIGAFLLYAVQLGLFAKAGKMLWKSDETRDKPDIKKKLNARPSGTEGRLLYVGMLSACVAFAVHLMFGLSLPSTTFLLWIFFAVLAVPTSQSVDIPPSQFHVAAFVVYLLIIMVPLYVTCADLWADRLFGLAMRPFTGSVSMETVELCKQASELSPNNDQYYIQYARYLLDVAYVSSDPASAQKSLSVAREVVRRFPNEYDGYAIALGAYDVASSILGPKYLDEGIALAKKQIATMPNGLALRLVYAQLLVTKGDTSEAIKQLEYCVAHDSNYTEAAAMLADIRMNNP